MVEFFDNAYRDGGRPTWDIGRPQGALVRLAGSGLIVGSVLDAGCGTGENALYLAARGHPVLGVDVAAAAIERALAKVADRDLPAEFLVADALDLGALGRTFDTVLDVGLFHTLSDAERPRYAASLGAALRPRRPGVPPVLERPEPVRARPATSLARGDPRDVPRRLARGGHRPRVARDAPAGRAHPRVAGADRPHRDRGRDRGGARDAAGQCRSGRRAGPPWHARGRPGMLAP